MTIQAECVHCTVPTGDGDVCTFCKTYQPPAQMVTGCTPDECDCRCQDCINHDHHDGGLEVAMLLAEGSRSECDSFCEDLVARIVNASIAFPLAGFACFVTADGNRITVTATSRDPRTGKNSTREFAAEMQEAVER
ncbi:hypothetical protein MTY66_57870 [Mycolicibacterium sp. TY66]|uniref:hypothetical protein n=1 Tax=unclassified Mycolicibacterium TaxID=2636767 RepID=UPI001BB33467|nr:MULTISPECIES: hypothetical protein [unclassified Mycolicibacterium]BCI84162.1 hypothetical protein MTY66_57870 [Mycolicibacterium sp. TY66]BCJ84218.1 hypothetical protein MTY81_55910 [Mycolicibacterium sp. TY81]